MPEGDTVFLTGRRLDEALAGRVLERAELRHPALATADLAGRLVREVASVGKHLLARLEGDLTLHSHLRLDGAWHLYRAGRSWRGGPAHDIRVILEVPDRVAVGYRLHDLALVRTAQEGRLVGHLGPDLLSPTWDAELAAAGVARLTAQPRREIGLVLLDQTVLAGIGNLYRAEVCFLLGVSPWTPVAQVDAAAVVDLAHSLLARNAWRPERSTTGGLGRGTQHWVYGRRGRPCRRCGTAVRSAPLGDPRGPTAERTVYFCPSCQPTPRSRGLGTGAVAASDGAETAGETTPRLPVSRRRPRSAG